MVKISKRRRIIKFFEDKELPLEFEQEEMEKAEREAQLKQRR